MSGSVRTRLRSHLLTLVWLTALWVLLWGELSAANLLGGLAVALAVGWVMPMPPVELLGRVRPLALLRLLGRFAVDLVVASVQVAALALDLRRRPRSAVIAVRLRSHSDVYLTLTAQLVSLVPGSLVVEAHRATGMLYVHVLDVPAAGVEAARADVLATEERVLRALASEQELAEAGLVAGRAVVRAGGTRAR